MIQDFLPFFMKQPDVTFATGTMIQPLSGLDVLTGLDSNKGTKYEMRFRVTLLRIRLSVFGVLPK